MTLKDRRDTLRRRRSARPGAERMEPRTLLNGAWGGYAGNAQHTAISAVASQALEAIHWQAPVDLAPQFNGNDLYIHYGTPVITAGGTLVLPVKTGAGGGFEVQGRNEQTGALLYTIATDYVLPAHDWVPSYSPALTSTGAVAMADIGGQICVIDAPDSAGAKVTRELTFFGQSNYAANPSAYDASVFVSTPITADNAGNLYFGYSVAGSNPLNLQGGLARIAADGVGTFVSAATAAGDSGITEVEQNCAPALSNDGKTVYVAVSSGSFGRGDLLALDSTTLATTGKVALIDPKSKANAEMPDDSTASPLVGPDGDVYFGVLENPFASNNDRGWLLHFSADLTQSKTPGAFGWDDTPSVVPASMIAGYSGPSTYLLMAKYNNYADPGLGGDGVNRIAVLDPNDAVADPVSGTLAMRPVRSIAGATPDPSLAAAHPFAVREWCINTAAVDPATDSILANSEDGKLYRWDLKTDTFSQVVTLTAGVGEAYTPTLIGPDGAVFAINNATLFAVGSYPIPSAVDDAYSLAEDAPLAVAAPGVLGNDTDGGGKLALTATLVSGPAHGSVALNADGSFTYTPTALYSGVDHFTYTATDGVKTSAAATVSISVTPVNHPPVARPDAYATNAGSVLPVFALQGVLANDSDPDPNTTLTAVLAQGPGHGMLTFYPDGSFLYTPAAGFSGVDQFTYHAGDGQATSAETPVTLTVAPVNHLPVATGTSMNFTQGRASVDGLIVATFNDADNEDPAGFRASIDWGDGTAASPGVVSGANSSYSVAGGHVYDAAGSFLATITITDPGGGSVTITSEAAVAPIGVMLSGSPMLAGNRAVDGAFFTNVRAPTILGTAPSGFIVQLFAVPLGSGASLPIGESTAGPDDTFQIAPLKLGDGAYTLNLVAADPLPSSHLVFRAAAGAIDLDTQTPRITSTVINLAKGTAILTVQDDGFGLDTSLALNPGQFSLIQTIRGRRAAIAATAVSPSAFDSPTGPKTIALTFKLNHLPKGVYAVNVVAGAIKDLAGNPLIGGVSAQSALKPVHPRGHAKALRLRR